MGFKETFGERLRQLRENKKMTQAELADAIGYSRASVGYYENADRTPDIEFLGKVAEFFKVSANYLLGFTSYRPLDEDESKELVSLITDKDETGKLAEFEIAISKCWLNNYMDEQIFKIWFPWFIDYFTKCIIILDEVVREVYIYNLIPKTFTKIYKINTDANILVQQILSSCESL